ncbi:MAG: HEAT repeat domain-containing protein [Planctomycetes bacterium]|nr:HEAT repeat domain-containing protein [Planctomycetota bacterium]
MAKDGELALFADYNDVREYGIVLYLVNRTGHRIGFAAQDDDPYVRLDALNKSGKWERAQKHYSATCGNSYDHVPSLRPGEFFRFLGYYPSKGKPSTVRYRMYQESVYILDDDAPEQSYYVRKQAEALPLDLISNAGPGRAEPADIAAARRDWLALKFGSFGAVRDLALGTDWGTWLGASRFQAVEALRRFPARASAPVLMALIEDSDRRVRGEAIRSLGIMGVRYSPAEKRFNELLTGKDLDLRAAAIRALSNRTMSREVIQSVRRLLDHKDARVRGAALVVLGKACTEFPEVHKILVEYGNDPDPDLQRFLENAQQRKLGWCQLKEVKANDGP